MVSIVEGRFQWPEHTIHSVCYGTTEHAVLLQDVLDFSAAQRIVSGQCQVMDTTHSLAELDATNQ